MNIKEFAALAGVSVSTVSKAMNDRGDVSLTTRRRLQTMAKEIGYIPNPLALGLKQKKTKLIGVILPNIRDGFFVKLLRGTEQKARKRGYGVLFSVSEENHQREKELLLNFSNGSVDGVLISLSKQSQKQNSTNHISHVLKSVPIVQFDRVCDGIDCEKIIIDDEQAAYMATQKLVALDAKTLIYLSTISETSAGRLRKKGFLKAIKGSTYSSNHYVLDLNGYSNFELSLRQYLRKPGPFAVLVSDELAAIRLQKFAQHLGHSIPKDISIIGFEDGNLSKLTSPPLTVVSQNAEKMGERAVDKLLYQINDGKKKDYYSTSIIESKLILRESTQSYE